MLKLLVLLALVAFVSCNQHHLGQLYNNYAPNNNYNQWANPYGQSPQFNTPYPPPAPRFSQFPEEQQPRFAQQFPQQPMSMEQMPMEQFGPDGAPQMATIPGHLPPIPVQQMQPEDYEQLQQQQQQMPMRPRGLRRAPRFLQRHATSAQAEAQAGAAEGAGADAQAEVEAEVENSAEDALSADKPDGGKGKGKGKGKTAEVNVKLTAPEVQPALKAFNIALPNPPSKAEADAYMLPSIRSTKKQSVSTAGVIGTNSKAPQSGECCEGCPKPCAVANQEDPVATIDLKIHSIKAKVDSHEKWLADAAKTLERLQADMKKVNDSKAELEDDLSLARKERTNIVLRESRKKLEAQLEEAKSALQHLDDQTNGLEDTAGALVQTKEALQLKIRSLSDKIEHSRDQISLARKPDDLIKMLEASHDALIEKLKPPPQAM